MADVVVTVPATFTWDDSPHRGLLAWADEGALPGEEAYGEYDFTTGGFVPKITEGERVYIVCEGRLRGYAPLVRLDVEPTRSGFAYLTFWREGGAVAVTIVEPITGFRGWRYRWWRREQERPFPDWLADARCRCRECRADKAAPLFDRVKEATND